VAVELTPNGTYGVRMASLPRPLAWAAIHLNVAFFRRLGNRVRVQGLPLLLLTTLGARSGQRRHTVLGGFDQGNGAWLIIASAAGSARHPAWYHNLAKHPDEATIEVGGYTTHVQAASLRGTERDAAWQQVIARAPGYASYARKTDREIPIIRLTPVG
jgi:deazaflavin-dependent oxidoreductase (nitroreductase family)